MDKTHPLTPPIKGGEWLPLFRLGEVIKITIKIPEMPSR